MKYIKKFEKSEATISIDLLSFCKFMGGMQKAVSQLQKIEKNSSYFEILSDNHKFNGTSISQFTILHDSSNKKYSEAINLNGHTRFSYGYLYENNYKLILIFHDVKIENIDTEILLFSDTQKYNI
jgi:hypothetical protein